MELLEEGGGRSEAGNYSIPRAPRRLIPISFVARCHRIDRCDKLSRVQIAS